ncbi:MAG: gamma-glutamyltransferase, partial [Acholeplasmataceae bacterium]|nr:gamma-glutamyltransferase [Acholeplasmataceae bacterium]
MISSHSHDTHARHAMAATTHPEAAQAGIDIMRAGGNAVDAAIAMAAMMTVVEPTSNGLGGDCFAIVKTPKGVFGLNSSGPAPTLLTLDALDQKGHQKMPSFGFDPVTVPGAVKGWQALHKRFGDIPFGDVVKPAIDAARKGFVVSPVISKNWNNALKIYQKHLQGPMFNAWFETFAKHGEAPSPGEIMTLSDHASTLEKIADTYGDAFYHGDLADQID